jgi:hypothetical protein
VTTQPDGADSTAITQARLDLARWHIDRYDRLRASTFSRAAVVLSAGAILTAGNAVILSQLLQRATDLHQWLLVLCTLGLVASASLIVLAIVRATGVLVSLQSYRTMFPDPKLPSSLVFNAPDTMRLSSTFTEFEEAVAAQEPPDILRAAHVELWIIIRQHRYRYAQLRSAVRALRYSATIFLAVLTMLVIANLIVSSI